MKCAGDICLSLKDGERVGPSDIISDLYLVDGWFRSCPMTKLS
jgi:hypothetical protein